MTYALGFLELIALSGLVFVEPVLGMLRKDAGNLISFALHKIDLYFTIAALVVVPAALLVGVEGLLRAVGIDHTTVLRALTLALLVGLFAIPVVKHATTMSGVGVAGVCVIAAVGAAFVLARWPWVSYTTLAALPVTALSIVAFLRANQIRRVPLPTPRPVAPITSNTTPRVALVVFDELPIGSLLDGHGAVDAGLFPNFASLAATSSWFRNTTTVAEHTHRAVPAILTGRYPTAGLLPSYGDHPNNIFAALGAAGYRVNSHETLTQISPHVRRDRWTTGWIPLIAQCTKLWRSYSSLQRGKHEWFGDSREFDDALAIGRRFIDTLAESSDPTFDALHILLPHRPWHYLGHGSDYRGDRTERAAPPVWNDVDAAEAGRQRHLLQLQTVDWLLGQIIDRLHSINAFDDTLLIVTADHGISFVPEAPARTFEPSTFSEVLWVPLFVKAPQQTTAHVDDRPVLTIDIVPTITDLIGAELPWALDGISVRDGARDPQEPVGRVMFDSATHDPDSLASARKKTFDGQTGFETAIAVGPWYPGTEQTLRAFQLTRFGRLIGREIATLPTAPRQAAIAVHGMTKTVDAAMRRDPNDVSWTVAEGTITGLSISHDKPVAAVTVNGAFAGFSELTSIDPTSASFQAILAPSLFGPGTNAIEVALIIDEPSGPHVHAIGT